MKDDVLSTATISDEVVAEVAREKLIAEVCPDNPDLLDPVWLKRRLEQARRGVLREIGVASVEEARALIADARDLRARLEVAHETITHALTEALTPLTERQRDLVCNLGENEPLAVLKTIAAIKPFWDSNK